MTSNEEIYLSYLCDRIMAACNRINKKLDVMDEQQRLFTYTDSYAPLQYSTPAYVTSWQTTAEPYFHNQPPSWQTPPPPPPQHYFHNQSTPSNDYHQSLQLSSQQPLVTAALPHQNYPQLPPPKTYQPPPSTSPTTYQQPPLTSAATATSLLHQNHQPQPPNAHQPPPPYSHQPPPPPNPHQPPTPPYVPPRQTTAAPTAQCHNYSQPPLHYLQQCPQSYRQPPLTAAAAASQPHQNYQPDGHQPCTGKPPLGWPPPPPQHSLSDWSPPSHGRSAAPLPAAAVAISKGKIDSSLSGLILFGRFDREQGNFNSVYGPRMKVQEGEAFESSSLEVQIKYSSDGARVVDCVCDRDKGELELCDSKDSILEKAAKTSMERDAFLSNEYYVSDIAWKELDSKLDVTIGPYWTYEDALLGCKATFEAFIGVRDDVATGKLKLFGDHLQVLERNLPRDDIEIAMAKRYATEFLKHTRSHRLFLESFGWNKFSVIEFDPGGDTSKLLFLTFFVVSWFPP